MVLAFRAEPGDCHPSSCQKSSVSQDGHFVHKPSGIPLFGPGLASAQFGLLGERCLRGTDWWRRQRRFYLRNAAIVFFVNEVVSIGCQE